MSVDQTTIPPQVRSPSRVTAGNHVEIYRTVGGGDFPNNPNIPLVLYRQAVTLYGADPGEIIADAFRKNGWGGIWRNGIYGVHHYHSTAHEVLGIYAGAGIVQFGGPDGVEVEVRAGDVIVIPAGVAHKRLSASPDFGVIGAYPKGQESDLCYGESGERPSADENIKRVSAPKTDPIYGASGPLIEQWLSRA